MSGGSGKAEPAASTARKGKAPSKAVSGKAKPAGSAAAGKAAGPGKGSPGKPGTGRAEPAGSGAAGKAAGAGPGKGSPGRTSGEYRPTVVRLPLAQVERLDDLADKLSVSRNAVVVAAIEHALGDLAAGWAQSARDGRSARYRD